jgi:hypothetical protein
LLCIQAYPFDVGVNNYVCVQREFASVQDEDAQVDNDYHDDYAPFTVPLPMKKQQRQSCGVQDHDYHNDYVCVHQEFALVQDNDAQVDDN